MADRHRPGADGWLDDDALVDVSAALDGETPWPEPLPPGAERLRVGGLALRSLARLGTAEEPPDIAAAVMVRLDDPHAPRRRRPTRAAPGLLRVAASVFVIGAVVGAVLGGLVDRDPHPASASLVNELLVAQTRIDRFDATIEIVEHGWHPEVPVRTATGHLAYRAPADLTLTLVDTTAYPDDSWLPNDVTVVVDDAEAWSSGRLGCPAHLRPGCLAEAPLVRAVVDRAPFSAGVAALDDATTTVPFPVDLVVPVGSFLPGASTAAGDIPVAVDGGELVVSTTVAALSSSLDPLFAVGDWRDLHPTDVAELRLDRSTLTVRSISVWAAAGPDRARWASRHGYGDLAGQLLVQVTVTPSGAAGADPGAVRSGADPGARPAGASLRSEGFVEDPAAGGAPDPTWQPDGLAPYRAGRVEAAPGPVIGVRSWTDGRSWVVLRSVAGWDADRLFGDLGALVRVVDLGPAGTAHVDPSGTRVALHVAGGPDVELTGTVGEAALLRMVGSLGLTGAPVPSDWIQAPAADPVPAGALRPVQPAASRVAGGVVEIAVAGPGTSGWVLTERPAAVLDPPASPDVVAVEVRGQAGRWDGDRGVLEWVEEGWAIRLTSDGLGRDDLLAVAAGLVR